VRRQGVRRKGGRKSKDLGGCYMQRLSRARESNGVGSQLCRRPLLWSDEHHRSRVLPPERALLVSLSGSPSSRLPLTSLIGPRISLYVCVCARVCACVCACAQVPLVPPDLSIQVRHAHMATDTGDRQKTRHTPVRPHGFLPGIPTAATAWPCPLGRASSPGSRPSCLWHFSHELLASSQ
jgi:hypothetical protein